MPATDVPGNRPALEDLATYQRPRTVGALVLCGLDPVAAAAAYDRVVVGALRGGYAGGARLAALIDEEVFEEVTAPVSDPPPADRLHAAVLALPWATRLQVVGALGLGRGSGAADLGRQSLAEALGDAGEQRLDVEAAVVDALARRAPTEPGGQVVDRWLATIQARRRRVTVVSAVVVAVVAVVVALVVALLVSRSSDDGQGASSSTTTGLKPITQWVAVLRTGPDAFALADEARVVGRTAGVYVMTDRWACYQGFPADTAGIDRAGWFLAVAANDKPIVDDLVAKLARQPLVEARVDQTCVQAPPADQGQVVVGPGNG